MRKIYLLLTILALLLTACKTEYDVSGPQGGIATTLRLPKGAKLGQDSLDLVVLMHGIFSSKSFPPMPQLARELAQEGRGPHRLVLMAPGAVIKDEYLGTRDIVNEYHELKPYTGYVYK